MVRAVALVGAVLASITPEVASVAGFGGFWTDPNHYRKGSLAGTRYISDEIGSAPSNQITLVGSDDGLAFWKLSGAWTDEAVGNLTVDFSPKGGPSDLKGQFNGQQIVWQDGNHWSRFQTPDFSLQSDTSGRTTLGGLYYDPVFPGDLVGTFRGSRMVSDELGDAPSTTITFIGSDDGNTFWSAKGSWVDKAAGSFVVDFSPKGGPANLGGHYSNGVIHWADGNHWPREAVVASNMLV